LQLTIPQAAELLRTNESQVHRWIRDRGLPAVLFREQYRLNRVSVMDWAQRHQIALADTGIAPTTATQSLAAALERGGIHRGVEGSTPAEVLASALSRLQLPAAVDLPLLQEMILARAARGTLCIGDGLAIPHARYPFIACVPEPILSVCFLAAPVDFGGDSPVTTLLVMLSPTVRAHLQLLSRLARALASTLREPVLSRANDAAILAAAVAFDATTMAGHP